MVKLFQPFRCKALVLQNRIVMAPMCMYVAPEDGTATKWHEVHYGARAIGGVGLILQEATAVEKRGRLTNNDLGIWSDGHIDGLSRIVETVHSAGGKIGIQIAHGGRKAWPGGEPIVAPSAIRFSEKKVEPCALKVQEIEEIVDCFRQGARRAVKAGYDVVEIHGAHGYLIHQFLSPHSNKREDEYGGSLENRLRFPLKIIKAVKEELPDGMPLFMRISAVEYLNDGYTFEEMVQMAKAFRDSGIDVIDVSTGGASEVAPETWPGFQIPYAEKLRTELGIPVIGCGLITTGVMAEETIGNGRIDLVAIGRGLLADPHWSLTAAKDLNVPGVFPKPYKRAYPDYLRK